MLPDGWENKGDKQKMERIHMKKKVTCLFFLGLMLIPSFPLAFLALSIVNPNISQKNIDITYLFLGHKFQDIVKYKINCLGSTHFPPQLSGNCVMKQKTTK